MASAVYFCFMITQQVDYHIADTPQAVNEIIKQRIEDSLSCKVVEIHSVLHDKDYIITKNPVTNETELTQKEPHIHTVVKLSDRRTIHGVATAIGLEPQYVEKPKTKGCHAYDNMLSYLIHAKDDEKYQYDSSEVHSICEDPDKIYSIQAEYYKTYWAYGKIQKSKTANKMSAEVLIDKIYAGEVTSLREIMLTNEYFDAYKYKSKDVDEALRVAADRKRILNAEQIQNGEISKTVVFVQGKAGKGKSTLAKAMIKSLEETKGWDTCHASSTNMVDDYNGEEILWIDDGRGTGMRAEDWVKLLDNHNCEPVSARYRNKLVSPQLIIITSISKLPEFFYNTKNTVSYSKEPLDQFLRRFSGVLIVQSENKIEGCTLIHLTEADGYNVSAMRVHYPEVNSYSEYKIVKHNNYDLNGAVEFIYALMERNRQTLNNHKDEDYEPEFETSINLDAVYEPSDEEKALYQSFLNNFYTKHPTCSETNHPTFEWWMERGCPEICL